MVQTQWASDMNAALPHGRTTLHPHGANARAPAINRCIEQGVHPFTGNPRLYLAV